MHRKLVVGGLLSLLMVLSVLAPPIGAQDDADEIAAVSLSLRRSPVGATVVPIDVSVVGRRALSGTLFIRARRASVNWEIPISIAANTEARQTVLVPVVFNEIDVEAEFVIDGDVIADSRLQDFNANGPDNAVGVLGLEGSGSVPMVPTFGEASLIEINDLSLLPGLDSIAASPAGIRSLSADEQRTLFGWAAAGRQLLIADESGSLDDVLPTEWRDDGRTISIGAGFLRYVGPDWEENIPPGPTISTDPGFLTNFGRPDQTALLSDAGFRVLGLGVLSIVLLSYLIVAGPITFGVLSARNNQTLAWVVLPALAVIFTIGVFVIGGFLTRGRGNGHASVVEVTPVGSVITDTLLIADDGRQEIDLPAGYNLVASALSSFEGNDIGSPVVVQPSNTGSTLVFEIEPGSGGTAIVEGRSDELDAALVVTDVELDGPLVSARVQNNSGEDLEHSIAFFGNKIVELETLADGETREFSIDLSNRNRAALPESRAWELNQNVFFDEGFGGPGVNDSQRDGPINAGAWIDWRARRNGTAIPSGMITVAGWTRDINVSQLSGSGRTVIVARGEVDSASGVLVPDGVRVVDMTPFNQFDEFGGQQSRVYQLIRPNGSNADSIAVEIQAAAQELEIWIDSEWRGVVVPDRGRFERTIPESAWSEDALWIRVGNQDFFGDPTLQSLRLVNARDDAVMAEILPSGESSVRNVEPEFQDGPFGEEVVLNLSGVVEFDDEDFFLTGGDIANSYDEWFVDLGEGDEITIEMVALDNRLDPFLIFRDPDGRQIAEDDDGGGGLNSRIQLVVNEAGQYRIEARPLSGGSNGSYDLEISVTRGAAT